MPFKSEKQRRLMWAKHPEIAKRWAHEGKGEHMMKEDEREKMHEETKGKKKTQNWKKRKAKK